MLKSRSRRPLWMLRATNRNRILSKLVLGATLGFAACSVELTTGAVSATTAFAQPSEPNLPEAQPIAASEPIPAPFEPITHEIVDRTQPRSPLLVRVWGRTYRFVAGPLPESIVSQGLELLTSAPELEVAIAGRGTQSLRWSPTRIIRDGARSLVLSSRAELGTATIQATTTIEYDGMLKTEVMVESGAPITIDAFRYRIRFAPQVAKWFNHHVRYDYETMNIDKVGLENSAGELSDGSRFFDYTPSLSIGNRSVGFEWWSEDNINWRTAAGTKPIRIERSADAASLSIEPISRPTRVESGWSHTFALFPLPLRPPAPDWRSNRFVSWSAARQFRQDDFDYYWIAFPVHFQARFHGLPSAFDNEEQRNLRRRLDERNVHYIPYGKLTAAPSHHARTFENADRWAANRQRFTGPSAGERKVMERNHGWKGRWYSYAVCTRNRDYLDWILEENLSALASESLDGLYFDFGSVSRMCETDPRIEDRDSQQAWHYFEVREFYKRLYERSRALAPDSLITIHTNGQPRALAAWVDYNFIGEALNVVFRDGLGWGAIKGRPDRYRPDYLSLRPGFMLAQIFPIVGGVTSILPELKFAKDPKNPGRLRSYQRAFFSAYLPEDVHFWFANSDHDELVRVMGALDSFGPLDSTEVLPHWTDREWVDHAPGVVVTGYLRGESLLVIVANRSQSPISTGLSIAPPVLSGPSGLRWSDLENAAAGKAPLTPETRFRVPPRDFKLLLIEPTPREASGGS